MQEVEAGLYQLPWQDAVDERKGLEEALVHAEKQRTIPQEMLKESRGECRYSALLSDAAVGENVAKNAFITKNVANTLKDQVGQAATETMRYRSGIELATWHETLANAEAAIAQLTAKLAIACRKEAFFTKDEKFRRYRAQISRQLAWLQIAEHCRTGSELNYDERLKSVKALDVNLQALAERLSVIETGIRTLYGLDLPFGKTEKGQLLDQGGVWLAHVSKWQSGAARSACRLSRSLAAERSRSNRASGRSRPSLRSTKQRCRTDALSCAASTSSSSGAEAAQSAYRLRRPGANDRIARTASVRTRLSGRTGPRSAAATLRPLGTEIPAGPGRRQVR